MSCVNNLFLQLPTLRVHHVCLQSDDYIEPLDCCCVSRLCHRVGKVGIQISELFHWIFQTLLAANPHLSQQAICQVDGRKSQRKRDNLFGVKENGARTCEIDNKEMQQTEINRKREDHRTDSVLWLDGRSGQQATDENCVFGENQLVYVTLSVI